MNNSFHSPLKQKDEPVPKAKWILQTDRLPHLSGHHVFQVDEADDGVLDSVEQWTAPVDGTSSWRVVLVQRRSFTELQEKRVHCVHLKIHVWIWSLFCKVVPYWVSAVQAESSLFLASTAKGHILNFFNFILQRNYLGSMLHQGNRTVLDSKKKTNNKSRLSSAFCIL